MVKKILFVTHQLSRTGAPQVLLNMILCCKELGHAVLAISLSDGDAREDWEKNGIDITVMPQLPQISEQMVPIIQKFDLVVVNTLVCLDVIRICAKAGVKSYWWIHEHEYYFQYFHNTLPKGAELGKETHVLAVSPLTEKLIRQYAGYQDVALLPFSVRDRAKEIISNRVAEDKKRFVCIGVYAYVKGQDILCSAIEQLTEEERVKCEFAFYGDRRQVDPVVYDPVAKTAEKYTEVSIYDTVPHDEMLKRIAEADYLIIPSRKEPMPTVAVEAMMLGKPCIISDICGVTDWLHDGKDALFFRVESVEQLAGQIRKAIQMDADTYQQMAKEGRNIYEQEFSEAVFRRNIEYFLEGEQ